MRKKIISLFIIATIMTPLVSCSKKTQDPNSTKNYSSENSVSKDSKDESTNNSKNSTSAFNTLTLNGDEIDDSIFKDHPITMINIWATFCDPCIKEMPELEKLYQELKKENVNLIGIIADTPDSDNEDLARTIIKEKGVTFQNIIPDENLLIGYLSEVDAVPTTIFVDENFNPIGEPIIGSRSASEYKKAIDELLLK